jgi:hypothetical protein
MDTVRPSVVHSNTQQEKSTLLSGAYGKSRLWTELARHPLVTALKPTARSLYGLLWSCAGGVETLPDGRLVLKTRRRFDWHPNKDGELVPGLAQLMGWDGPYAARRVGRALKQLVQGGMVEVKYTGRSPIIYMRVPPMVPGVEVRRDTERAVRADTECAVRAHKKCALHYAESSSKVFMQSHDQKTPPPSPSQASAQVVRMQANNRTAEGGDASGFNRSAGRADQAELHQADDEGALQAV